MIKTALISTGTEILTGRILESNKKYFAEKLFKTGIKVNSFYSFPDDYNYLVSHFRKLVKEYDILIIMGGLGPTDDDITREVVAEAAKRKLIFNKSIFRDIDGFFKKRGIEMKDINRKQAYIIDGSVVIKNKLGTAPGFKLVIDKTYIYAVPGVPVEAYGMMDSYILKDIKKIFNPEKRYFKVISLTGIGESAVAGHIREIEKEAAANNVNIGYRAYDAQIDISIDANNDNMVAGKIFRAISKKLNNFIFSKNGENIVSILQKAFIKNNLQLSIAESCTGGMLAKMITDINGSSMYFSQCIVSYSNEAKINLLKVKKESLIRYGAVSRNIAKEMAEGIIKVSGSDYSIAVTGIAGPSGGSKNKPVGLVYIAVSGKSGTHVYKHIFCGTRDMIRTRTAKYAFFYLLRLLNK